VHQLGRNEEALTLIRRAVQLEPKASYTWCALGSLHLALGNVSEALWSFEQSRRVNGLPDASPFPDAGGYIAECLRVLGRLAEAREQCMTGLEKIEQSDHMYRDTFRVFTLVELGVIAAEQQDWAAARTAFHQAIGHIKGRPRTLAGGSLVVRALAGLAVVDRDKGPYDEARSRFETRTELDFSFMYLCDEARTRADLERARDTVGVDRGA
jgi:tetratricopeptide (TPR) repeat protein